MESVNQLRKKVHEDYKKIAKDFSASRVSVWKDFGLFTPYLKKHASVLDVGCGNGRLLLFLNGKFDAYLGIDQIPYFISEAQKKFGHEKKVQFLCEDLIEWKGEGNQFDEVFCIATLHHIPSEKLRKRVIKEWFRVIKPGGAVFVTNWNVWQRRYVKYLWWAWFAQFFGRKETRDVYIPFKGAKEEVNRYVHAFTREELHALFESCGFEVVLNEYVADGEVTTAKKGKNIVLIAVKPLS